MKILSFVLGLLFLLIRSSCTSNDEPATPPVFMLPSSIESDSAGSSNESFVYDDYGRIVDWSLTGKYETYTARYSYPDDNTILVSAKNINNGIERYYEETIQLINGRALKSEGTFVYIEKDRVEMQKTYRLEFEYDQSNHLTVVKHLEVMGIGDNIRDEWWWEKPWTWENYLIWEDGNLKEFQDYHGGSEVMQTTKFEYLDAVADYPIIVPLVTNIAHHIPLFMQERLGLNSRNLVSIMSEYDHFYRSNSQTRYTYELDQSRIVGYDETHNYNTSHPVKISYKVYWTER